MVVVANAPPDATTVSGDAPDVVTVTFVNNFIYPGLSGDRNVYVDSLSYDGQTISTATTPVYQSPFFPPNSTDGNNYGNASFVVNDTTPVPAGVTPSTTSPAAVSIGSGPDNIVLNMAEDPYQGDAQFTVSVDGQQIGGVQTTTAVVSQGQSQEFDVHGNFGPGTHDVAVTFLNDAVGGYYPAGTPGLPPGQWALDTEDRNLYVMGVSDDGGTPASGAPWELSSDGTESFTVTAGSNPSATATSSGLFGTDGAAATSDNIAVTSGSLASSTTSNSMTFVAPTTPSPTPSDTTSSGTVAPTTTDTATTVPAAASTSASDFIVPATTASSDSATTTSTAASTTWWSTQDTGGGYYHHYQG